LHRKQAERAYGVVELLVGYVAQQQPEQRLERELRQWEREQRQQEQRQPRSGGAGRLVIGPELYSFRALWRQYRSCRRNKRNSFNALAFEVDAEANLLQLQAELRAHTYRPGRSICFMTGGPKPREMFTADFRDRIVHHLLVGHQERVFEPRFIHDSYACRPGKGDTRGQRPADDVLRRETANGQRAAWALNLDVASLLVRRSQGLLRLRRFRRLDDAR
jgi:RNA-directed DNA polymerase